MQTLLALTRLYTFIKMKNLTIREFAFFSLVSMDQIFVFSPNAGKYGPEKTPYLDTFHVVNYFVSTDILSEVDINWKYINFHFYFNVFKRNKTKFAIIFI